MDCYPNANIKELCPYCRIGWSQFTPARIDERIPGTHKYKKGPLVMCVKCKVYNSPEVKVDTYSREIFVKGSPPYQFCEVLFVTKSEKRMLVKNEQGRLISCTQRWGTWAEEDYNGIVSGLLEENIICPEGFDESNPMDDFEQEYY